MVTLDQFKLGDYYQHDDRMMVGPLEKVDAETNTVTLDIMGEKVQMPVELFQRKWNPIVVPNLDA
jgi:hypothetical protein